MVDSNTDRIRQLRLRAEEVRTVADALRDLDARRTLFGVAGNYEGLAEFLGKLSKPKDEHENAVG